MKDYKDDTEKIIVNIVADFAIEVLSYLGVKETAEQVDARNDKVVEKILSLIQEERQGAVEGFVNEFLRESARTDKEIGMNPKDKKIQRWVDINSLREDMEEYLKSLEDKDKEVTSGTVTITKEELDKSSFTKSTPTPDELGGK